MSDRSLLQRVGGTHICHQVTGGKYTADIASGDPAAVRTQHIGPLLNAFRRQRDVIGDHHIILATSLGDPHVGGVGTVIHDDKTDQRMGIGPDATIADHHRPAVMTDGNSDDLVLYRTGICVDIDRHNAPTINQPGPHCTRRDGQAYPSNGMPAGSGPAARGGSVLFRNAHTLDRTIQSRIADVITFEDERRQESTISAITGWFFVGPSSWMEDPDFDIAPDFANTVDGKTVVAPPLSQRSDFPKVACAVIADISQEHSLSPVALSILQAESWPGNLKQLRKTIQHAVAQATGKVIRQDIRNVLQSFARDGITPCSQCIGSSVREETCIMIRRTWKDTGGNVSLVARRLGVSRNTVYKHVRES